MLPWGVVLHRGGVIKLGGLLSAAELLKYNAPGRDEILDFYLRMILASTTVAPLSWTITGLRSISRISG